MGFEPEEFVVSEPKSAASKSTQRVIKKYPNRRLYDTDTSTYITLAEVRQLVMDHQNVVVRDAKTGEDLTRSILLQIILEEEAGGAPMFTEAVLANIIRFYGHAMQGFMGAYLEKNVQAFTDVQAKLAEQSQSVTPEMWSQFMSLQAGDVISTGTPPGVGLGQRPEVYRKAGDRIELGIEGLGVQVQTTKAAQ